MGDDLRRNRGQKSGRRRRRARRRAIRAAVMVAALALAAGGVFYLRGPEPAADVGRPAPPFALPDAAGRTISLADFQGRQPLVLAFYMFAG